MTKAKKVITNTKTISRFNTAAMVAVLLFALTGTLLAVLSKAAGNATLTLTPSSGTFGINTGLTVAVHEDSGSESVSTVDVKLAYDPSKLQFVSISTAGSPFNFCTESFGGGGQISIVCANIGGSVTGRQFIGNINFQVLAGSGSTSIAFRSESKILKNDGTDANIWNGNMAGGTYSLSTPANTSPPASGSGGGGGSSTTSPPPATTSPPAGGGGGGSSTTTSPPASSATSPSLAPAPTPGSASAPQEAIPQSASGPEAVAQGGIKFGSGRALLPLGIGLLVLMVLLIGLPFLQSSLEMRQIKSVKKSAPVLHSVASAGATSSAATSHAPVRILGSSAPGMIVKPHTNDMTLEDIEQSLASKNNHS